MSLITRTRALWRSRPAAAMSAVVASLSLVTAGLLTATLLPGAAQGAPTTLLAASCGTTNLALGSADDGVVAGECLVHGGRRDRWEHRDALVERVR